MHDRHALHQVGQFTHVARPAVTAQRHDRRRVETDRAAFLVLHARNQFVHQQRDVFHALTQWRHLDGEYVKAVVQVFAERTHLDHAFEVLVGRGDDAHVDVLGLVAADPLEGALLQHAQQLDLQRQRHVADLVEEQGAAVGQLETPGAAGNGASEGTLLVAEQLAFQQLCRNRPAVDRDERRFAALGVIVQVARHHFLAGPGLTEDQHAGVGIGDLLHHLPHLLDGTAGTDQAAEQVRFALATAFAGLIVHFPIHLGTVQRVEQFVVAGRHFQAGQHPAAEVVRPLGGGNLGDQQDRQELVPASQLLEQLNGTALGLHIAQQHAEHVATAVGQGLDRSAPVATAATHLVFTEEIEDHREFVATLDVIVDQQDLGFAPHDASASNGRGLDGGGCTRQTINSLGSPAFSQ
ncbi:MAG: hypothetical protein GAK43_01545 [Stenotrophomonas maltophilia]|nr:MAG: hypothetical protein GAK43_01545 [Stenotrophomonas maltophilia]